MGIIEGIRLHSRLFGPRGTLLVAKARFAGKPLEIAVMAEGIKHPIHLRLRTTDVSLFEAVILKDEYSCFPRTDPTVIVDAGANIGLAAVYLANAFPNARVFAIEPEQGNFEMLEKNASYYPNVTPIHGALWSEDTQLTLDNPGEGNWGFRTRTFRTGEKGVMVRPLSMPTLMSRYQINHIDVLKVDIEGAEKDVFAASRPWIDKVGLIMVETHYRSKDGCSAAVAGATSNFRSRWHSGETTYLERDGGPRTGRSDCAAARLLRGPSGSSRCRIVADVGYV